MPIHPVLDTLEYVRRQTGVWMELTTLLIPGHNDSPEEVAQLTRWVHEHLGAETLLHFSAFHPAWKMMDVPSTPPETLRGARTIARESGLKHVYLGNIRDAEGSTTYCASCGESLIERDGFEVTAWRLTADSRCPRCQAVLAGVFDPRPAEWGNRRKPMTLG